VSKFTTAPKKITVFTAGSWGGRLTKRPAFSSVMPIIQKKSSLSLEKTYAFTLS